MVMEVNNLLCYVTTACNSLAADDIVNVCVAYYGSIKIKEAKQVLANYLKEDIKWRRGDDKIKGDMHDIVEMVKKCDEIEIELPKFVADSYNALPPTSGFEIIGEAISQLYDEINKLKNEVSSLKDLRIRENEANNDITSIKENLLELKGDLRKLNTKVLTDELRLFGKAFNNVGERMETRIDSIENNAFARMMKTPSAPSASQMSVQNRSPLYMEEPQDEDTDTDDMRIGMNKMSFSDEAKSAPITKNNANHEKVSKTQNSWNSLSYQDPNYNTGAISKNSFLRQEKYERKNSTDNDGFTLVDHKKKRRKDGVFGKKMINEGSNFKSAKRTIDLYIGQCGIEVECETIKEHLVSEMQINDVEICQLNCKNPRMKSFKLTINFTDKAKVMSEEAWPEGILCRRFFTARSNTN